MTAIDATIIRGEALDVLRTLPSESVAGVITDPPYSSGGQFRGDRTGGQTATEKYIKNPELYAHDFGGDSRDQRSFLAWCALWMSEARRVTTPGGVIACFTDWRQLPTVTDAIQAGGWIWRGILPWDKTEATRPQPARPRAQAEFVVWGSSGPMDPKRDAPVMPGVLRCRVQRDKVHPTQKPIPMLRDLMRLVVRGGTVLDPFVGSGAHGAAALLEGHPFIGIEMSEPYAEIARQTIEQTIAAHGLSASELRKLEARGGRVGGPTQVTLFDG
ncbi:MAG TPA: site-specific DNA-methyltransferase [Polyangiaceae bacterium]|nr:site-specific DNA-methyltransferase [Polyangiaceae bacterium]